MNSCDDWMQNAEAEIEEVARRSFPTFGSFGDMRGIIAKHSPGATAKLAVLREVLSEMDETNDSLISTARVRMALGL